MSLLRLDPIRGPRSVRHVFAPSQFHFWRRRESEFILSFIIDSFRPIASVRNSRYAKESGRHKWRPPIEASRGIRRPSAPALRHPVCDRLSQSARTASARQGCRLSRSQLSVSHTRKAQAAPSAQLARATGHDAHIHGRPCEMAAVMPRQQLPIGYSPRTRPASAECSAQIAPQATDCNRVTNTAAPLSSPAAACRGS
jgi:hypothetical protein